MISRALRVALVTGGAGGLGLATGRRLAADGLTVALCDLDEGRTVEATAGLHGGGDTGRRVDVADEASVAAAFDAVESALGPVAVLACFAGIGRMPGARTGVALVEVGSDEWDRVMEVNARGTFLCVREMLRRRRAQPVAHGRIIVVSSVAGQFGAIKSGAVYSASKGAVLSLMKVAAREAAPLGLTVNAIAPGPVDTPLLATVVGDDMAMVTAAVPLKRIGQPQDVGAAASYLASPMPAG